MAIRDLSKAVKAMVISDTIELPWFAKPYAGQVVVCTGCHHISTSVRFYVSDIAMPNDDHFMVIKEHQVKEFIYG